MIARLTRALLAISAPMFVLVAALHAQSKAAAMSGVWTLDVDRLETKPATLPPSAIRGMLVCGPADERPSAVRAWEQASAFASNRWPNASTLDVRVDRSLFEHSRPASTLEMQVSDSALLVRDDESDPAEWPLDGAVHRMAQIEGGTLAATARWKGDALVLELANPACKTSVVREFRLSPDGTELRLKIDLKTRLFASHPIYFYTRADSTHGKS